jgi:hypothetical protein
MDDEQFCKEVRRVLNEVEPDKRIFKKVLKIQEAEMEFAAYRYQYKKGEEAYKKLIKFKKVSNLICHLLELNSHSNK